MWRYSCSIIEAHLSWSVHFHNPTNERFWYTHPTMLTISLWSLNTSVGYILQWSSSFKCGFYFRLSKCGGSLYLFPIVDLWDLYNLPLVVCLLLYCSVCKWIKYFKQSYNKVCNTFSDGMFHVINSLLLATMCPSF